MNHLVIYGATSAIATEVARKFSKRGSAITLVARRPEALEKLASDLRVRGASKVEVLCADLNDTANLSKVVAETFSETVSHVLVAYGILGDTQGDLSLDEHIKKVIEVNFLSQAVLCELVGEKLCSQNVSSTLTVITSVAGDRGRKSNYLYGSSKAGMSAFLSGLRGKLDPSGVKVLDVRPGFVDTAMTSHIEKKTLPATAEKVGKDIYKAMMSGNKYVLYTPFFWRYIMLVVRLIPTGIFKKLNF